jgi:hypothetical protein
MTAASVKDNDDFINDFNRRLEAEENEAEEMEGRQRQHQEEEQEQQDQQLALDNGNGKSRANKIDVKSIINSDTEAEEEEEGLAAESKLTAEDINFVINTITKEAEYDGLSIKQLFYGMASAFTKRPIHHIVNSKEAGAGKNYLLELVSRYFPNQYVTPLGNMSDKALFHRRGILVETDPNTGKEQPILPIIMRLNEEKYILEDQIAVEKSKKNSKSRNRDLIQQNKKRIFQIESEIKDIELNAQKVIDLENQIILCLDTPQSSLYDAIMSIVSQDTPKDQEYSFVDKTSSGKLVTKNNKIRGTPVIIPTQVIDDTRTQRFQEKNRRFINVNPDTSSEKIHAAKNIMALQGGYLPDEYDELVVSRRDKERAKQIVAIVVAKLKQHSKSLQPKDLGVKIPFALSIAASIPNSNVWAMTVNDRIIKYLSIIVKTWMDFRPRILNTETGQFYPIATFEDLKETLYLMQVAASGIKPYLSRWYNERFVPAFEELDSKPNEDISENGIVIAKEKHVGLTTEQLANKIKQLDGYKPSSKELLEKYLYPLCNQGILDSVKSEINGKYNIYFPVEEGNLYSIFDDTSSSASASGNLKLKVSQHERFPSNNFLKEQFRILSRRSSNDGGVFEKNFSCYKLLDVDGSEITVDQIIDKYYNNAEECFVKGYPELNEVDDSNSNNMPAPADAESLKLAAIAIATRNNVSYQHQIIQKNIFQNNPTLWNNVLTEFPEKVIEESMTASYYCSCYYCGYKTYSKDDYDAHIVLGHNHCIAYPNKAEIEKRGLKPQGKEWEI